MKYEKPEVTLVNPAVSAIQHPMGSKTGGPIDGLNTANYQVTVNAYAADE